MPVSHVSRISSQDGHLLEAFDRIVTRAPMFQHSVPEEWFEIGFVDVFDEAEIAGVFVNVPRADDMIGGRSPHG